MHQNYLVLTPNKIEEYLVGRENIDNTKDYELGLALILIKFHSKETGKKLKVALLAKEPVTEGENLIEVFKDKIKEDHDIDIYLIPDDLDLSSKEKHKVSAFQLKRFFFNDGDSSKKLLQYLTEQIPKKYSPGGDGILTLLIKGDISFSKEDFEEINSAIRSIPKYPFGRVMFITGKDKERIVFGDLFPNWGHKTYSYNEWFSDEIKN